MIDFENMRLLLATITVLTCRGIVKLVVVLLCWMVRRWKDAAKEDCKESYWRRRIYMLATKAFA